MEEKSARTLRGTTTTTKPNDDDFDNTSMLPTPTHRCQAGGTTTTTTTTTRLFQQPRRRERTKTVKNKGVGFVAPEFSASSSSISNGRRRDRNNNGENASLVRYHRDATPRRNAENRRVSWRTGKVGLPERRRAELVGTSSVERRDRNWTTDFWGRRDERGRTGDDEVRD